MIKGLPVRTSPQVLHCVLEQDTLSSDKYCLTQEDPPRHNWKIVDWDVKNQHKQTNICLFTCLEKKLKIYNKPFHLKPKYSKKKTCVKQPL